MYRLAGTCFIHCGWATGGPGGTVHTRARFFSCMITREAGNWRVDLTISLMRDLAPHKSKFEDPFYGERINRIKQICCPAAPFNFSPITLELAEMSHLISFLSALMALEGTFEMVCLIQEHTKADWHTIRGAYHKRPLPMVFCSLSWKWKIRKRHTLGTCINLLTMP